MNAYHFPCYDCESGLISTTDAETGNCVVETCRWCYRGRITIRLKPEDEAKLFEQLRQRVHAA